MSSSAAKRPASFNYGRPGQTALLTPEPSPSYFATSAESHPSPLLLPTASLPPTSALPAPAKSKSKAASAKSQRKINHSIIEKRRREKINGCLVELRDLVPAESSDGSGEGDSKGEFKLGTLVRTVEYVKELQRKIQRLEIAQQSISSGTAVRVRSSTRGDQSPWQGIETESDEGGLSPGASDMSVDDAAGEQVSLSPPPSVPRPAPASASLPNQAQLYGSPAGPYHRQSAPAFVPIGFQRLPSISSMLPPTSNMPGSASTGHPSVSPPLPPTQPRLGRAHSSFSSFASLPGARVNYHLVAHPPAEHRHHRQGEQHPALAQGGKDELRAAELLLAISSPELRGLAGGEDELEDWSLGGKLLGA